MTVSQPLISICIPAYNAEQFIVEAIQSALTQTYPNIEILIQDNASTDNTWALVQSLAQQHASIYVQQNSANFGPTYNFNQVVARARGDYINILSADDALSSQFVEKCLSVFAQHPVDVVTTNYALVKAGRKKSFRIKLTGGIPPNLPALILLQNPFMQPFTLFARRTVEQFTSNGKLFQTDFLPIDFDLWLRMAFRGIKIFYLPDELGMYRKHGGNLSDKLCRLNPQVVLVVLKLRRQLKQACPFAYRLTLIRFVIRQFVYFGLYGCRPFNKRALYSAWYELFR
jgi:glycosyltransferase involved in cell wall biosynthesis